MPCALIVIPLEREVKAHDRAVNRICWHPTDPNSLLSASQDGLIKLWDQRHKGVCTAVFQQQKSESVRDVKFNLFEDTRFAAAFENGSVEIWDVRNNKQPETKFTAHQGHILSIDWHPSKARVIATGSRDRSVKRPFVPLACLQGHADIVSDFEWFDTPLVQSFGGATDTSLGTTISNNSLNMQHPPRKVKSAANLAPSMPRIPSFKAAATKRNVSSGSLPNSNTYDMVHTLSHHDTTSQTGTMVPQAMINASSFHSSMSADQMKAMLVQTAAHPPAAAALDDRPQSFGFNQQVFSFLAQTYELHGPSFQVEAYPYDEHKEVAVPSPQTYGKSADVSRIQDTLLKELLEFYSEAGDVQSCTTISAAMSYVTSIEALMGKGWLQQVYMHYIGNTAAIRSLV
ncbi:hypothetical protein DYB28_007245 [Aphanomyces astaci]|uniref:Anaphase-promoting complex subunit 4 WD40 domain-containing protein n=1 Tax=Aphanomyces astaci TaxID=112090 RepID=A0A9X8E9Y0_APHAT|nr:hypothetical protein DYB28_007245 [Aphanomyces astaci]